MLLGIVVIIFVVLVVFGFVYKNKSKEELMNLADFLTIFREDKKIVRVEVYYMPWFAQTFKPITIKELTSGGKPYLKIVGDQVYVYSSIGTNDVFESLKHSDKKIDSFNFRYSCVFYSNTNKVIRFSLALGHSDVLVVNEQPYKCPFELVDSLLQLLPAKNYKSIIEDITIERKLLDATE